MINQKKCEHCNNWTDGDKAFCDTCGGILDFKYRKERDDLEKDPLTLSSSNGNCTNGKDKDIVNDKITK